MTATASTIVGRDTEVAALIADLEGHGRVVLVGPAGVGKTAVADAVVAELSSAGTHNCVVSLRATPARGEIPFGVIAHMADVSRPSPTVSDAIDAVAESVAAMAGERRLTVIIDDWPLLDKESTAVVEVLAERYDAAVLATMRTEGPVSEAVTCLRSQGFTVVELAALDRNNAIRVAAALLGSTLTPAAADDLWRRSRGNPLFIRELVAAGIQSDAELPSRVAEMISLRLSSLDSPQREALRMLAVAGELPGDVVAGIIPRAVVDQLVAAEWIVAADSGTFRLAHPLIEEAIRESASPVELVATARTLAHIARAEHCRALDVLQVARWHVVGGVDASSSLWRAAARRARVLAQTELATQFAEAAVHAAEGDGVAEALTLVEILTSAGDFQRAEDTGRDLQQRLTAVLAGSPIDQAGAETLAIVALSRSHNAFWGLGDAAVAMAGLDDAIAALRRCDDEESTGRARLELLAERASYLAFTGAMSAGVDAADAVLTHRSCDPRAATRAHFAAGIALMQLGRPRDAEATLRRGLEQAGRIPTFGRGQFTTFLTSTLVLALVECGDVAGAIALGRDGLNDAMVNGDLTRRSLAHYALGRALLARGHAAQSDEVLSAAVDLDVGFRAAGYASWSLVCLIHSRALHRGNAQHLGTDLSSLLDSLPTSATRFWEGEADRSTAWALIAGGNVARGTEMLERAYRVAVAGGQRAMAAWIAHDLMRVAGRAIDADRVLAVTDSIEGTGVYELLRRHAVAHRGSIEELICCAEAFAAAGFDLLAAEIWFDVAARQGRRAAPRLGPDAHANGRRLTEECGVVHTPGIVLGLGSEQLTPRQRHIAHLASRGLGNREIAARLGLSVRTVANQLQRVYDATGLGRGDLAEVVGA